MNRSLRLIRILAAAAVLAALIAWLAGAFEEKIPPARVVAQAPPVAGERYTLESVVEDMVETATGTITARDETTVSARILAAIRELRVRSGDTVAAGDVLVELDDRDLESRVRQSEQSELAAKARLDEARADFERVKTLFERQLASRADYDRVQASLRSRQADYERSRRQLEEARTALSFTTIRSPIEGRVIERYAEPGDTASPGMPLIKIYNPSLLRLDAQVRESLAARIGIGDRMSARIDALGRELPVTVDEIVPSADPGSRSITVRALLPTDDALYPGMFGRLLIPVGETERLYVPARAIRRLGQLEFVEVLEDARGVRRFIRTGRENDQAQLEVLSGLRAGETVLIPMD